MKKVFIFLITGILVILSGCASCIKYPEPKLNDKGLMVEPQECYDYRLCMYYSAVSKNYQSDCKLEFEKCCKIRRYEFCRESEKRWEESNAQSCWDKLD